MSGGVYLKELSIFVDESGDFGSYRNHSPYYIITLVFHDQAVNISQSINLLNDKILQSGLPTNPIHAGPLIRKESEYKNLSLLERKRVFNFFYNFVRTTNIKYHTIIIEKKHLIDNIDLHIRITKQLAVLLKDNLEDLLQNKRIIVYYDFGQLELAKILVTVFNTILNNVEFRKVNPAHYKLFQAADLLCTLELLAEKSYNGNLSKSEITFFTSKKNLYKAYIKAIHKKRLT